jgi:hypothetical protein
VECLKWYEWNFLIDKKKWWSWIRRKREKQANLIALGSNFRILAISGDLHEFIKIEIGSIIVCLSNDNERIGGGQTESWVNYWLLFILTRV